MCTRASVARDRSAATERFIVWMRRNDEYAIHARERHIHEWLRPEDSCFLCICCLDHTCFSVAVLDCGLDIVLPSPLCCLPSDARSKSRTGHAERRRHSFGTEGQNRTPRRLLARTSSARSYRSRRGIRRLAGLHPYEPEP